MPQKEKGVKKVIAIIIPTHSESECRSGKVPQKEKMMKKVIAVIVPAHNESECLGRLLRGLPHKVEGYVLVPVVVDDGSTDSTVEIANQFTKHVVRLETNQGVGAATRAGLTYVAQHANHMGEGPIGYVFKIDGDGQHDPDLKNFEMMLHHLLGGATLVTGSRFSKESEQRGTPVDRALLNCMFADVVSRITGWGVSDARTGFMGMPIEVATGIVGDMVVERYGVPINIILAGWNMCRQASKKGRFAEIVLPAKYKGDISSRCVAMYADESVAKKNGPLHGCVYGTTHRHESSGSVR